jgi:hypothetical protein
VKKELWYETRPTEAIHNAVEVRMLYLISQILKCRGKSQSSDIWRRVEKKGSVLNWSDLSAPCGCSDNVPSGRVYKRVYLTDQSLKRVDLEIHVSTLVGLSGWWLGDSPLN